MHCTSLYSTSQQSTQSSCPTEDEDDVRTDRNFNNVAPDFPSSSVPKSSPQNVESSAPEDLNVQPGTSGKTMGADEFTPNMPNSRNPPRSKGRTKAGIRRATGKTGIERISVAEIRRLARRAGARRVSTEIYPVLVSDKNELLSRN